MQCLNGQQCPLIKVIGSASKTLRSEGLCGRMQAAGFDLAAGKPSMGMGANARERAGDAARGGVGRALGCFCAGFLWVVAENVR